MPGRQPGLNIKKDDAGTSEIKGVAKKVMIDEAHASRADNMKSRKATTTVTPRLVERLIETERWVDARHAIEELLKRRPSDHWLITRLSTTYYEMGDYAKALGLADQALELVPDCPLAMWDKAGALDMLGRGKEALAILVSLLKMIVEAIELNQADDFGEGGAWTLGLVADCAFRIGLILEDLGLKGEEVVFLFQCFLKLVDLGAESIYERDEAVAKLQSLRSKKAKNADVKILIDQLAPWIETYLP
jgi:tetratricopeptide (TPR) repeat protein